MSRSRAIMAPGDGRGWRRLWRRVTCGRCYGSGGAGGVLACGHCDGKGDLWERRAQVQRAA